MEIKILKFEQAFEAMKQESKIKLPLWGYFTGVGMQKIGDLLNNFFSAGSSYP